MTRTLAALHRWYRIFAPTVFILLVWFVLLIAIGKP